VSLVNGEQVSLELAERGYGSPTICGGAEVRQRSESDAQSSILSTDYRPDLSRVAAAMFARWKSPIAAHGHDLFGRTHNGSRNRPRQRHTQGLLTIGNEDLPRLEAVEMTCQPKVE
jgi:hypothetical protein